MHELKALAYIPHTEAGIKMVWRAEQEAKASLAIESKLSGKAIEVRLVHPLKAYGDIPLRLIAG